MSQLQAQRQDPYSESNLDSYSNTNLHADNFGFKWTYIDGTPGDDGKDPIEGKPAARQRKISRWIPETPISRPGTAPMKYFTQFEPAKPGPNGSIDYSDVSSPENLILTIAWEKMWRGRAEQERNQLRKEVHSMKTGNARGNAGGKGHGTTITNFPDGRVVTVTNGSENGTNHAQQPKKKKRKSYSEKPAPSKDRQLEIFKKQEARNSIIWDRNHPDKLGQYPPRDFDRVFFREPGTKRTPM
jgi:hypothetical protein